MIRTSSLSVWHPFTQEALDPAPIATAQAEFLARFHALSRE